MYVFIATKLVSSINYVGPLSPIHPPFTQGLLQPVDKYVPSRVPDGYARNGRLDLCICITHQPRGLVDGHGGEDGEEQILDRLPR
jgi:hypothetical protein